MFGTMLGKAQLHAKRDTYIDSNSDSDTYIDSDTNIEKRHEHRKRHEKLSPRHRGG